MTRKVRVATVAYQYHGGPTVQDNRERLSALLDQAVAQRPDIISLPETIVSQGVSYTALDQIAEPVPGPTLELASGYARRHHCYIICPLVTVRGERYYNEAVLLDRRGEIVGAYAKIHPVVQGAEFRSLEMGITPGHECRTFETDFGRIGIQICFDIMYPEGWAELKRQGAEIVFWCSAYDGGRHLAAYAWWHHYYVVSSVQSRIARIYGLLGQELAQAAWYLQVIAHTLELDIGLFHCDFNASVLPDILEKYGPDVTIDMGHEEGMFTLASNREGLSVADLVREFALDPVDAYVERNARLQQAWRKGEPAPDLTPPYIGRRQWV